MIRAAALLLLLAAVAPAAAGPLITGSGRTDAAWVREAPEELLRVEDGATNLDGWYELRAIDTNWDAAARLRLHLSSGVEQDTDITDLDRRHLAIRSGGIEAWAGNFYSTLGNGIILRTLEQRFVTLSRVERAFNLDNNLDGVRLTGEYGPGKLILFSGKPSRTFLAPDGAGGTTQVAVDDLLQGADGNLDVTRYVTLGAGYVQANLTSPDGFYAGRSEMDLASGRATARYAGWEASFEYAELRPTGALRDSAFARDGFARYGRLTGPLGPVGISAEYKSYRRFDSYRYNQPPTAVRTHDAVLLNRNTHVVLLNDEKGFQVEGTWSPGLFTEIIGNVAASNRHEADPFFEYREVYLSARHELEDVGAGRIDLDWQRDRIKFHENVWTGLAEAEKFLADGWSVVGEVELQWIESNLGEDYAWQFVQVSLARAGRWTLAVSAEHTDQPARDRTAWFFATLTATVNRNHDVTLGAGTRPAGLVCSGGFCFDAPAFDGVELRLLSRF